MLGRARGSVDGIMELAPGSSGLALPGHMARGSLPDGAKGSTEASGFEEGARGSVEPVLGRNGSKALLVGASGSKALPVGARGSKALPLGANGSNFLAGRLENGSSMSSSSSLDFAVCGRVEAVVGRFVSFFGFFSFFGLAGSFGFDEPIGSNPPLLAPSGSKLLLLPPRGSNPDPRLPPSGSKPAPQLPPSGSNPEPRFPPIGSNLLPVFAGSSSTIPKGSSSMRLSNSANGSLDFFFDAAGAFPPPRPRGSNFPAG